MSQPVLILLIEDDEEDYIITRDILADIPNSRYRLEWVSSFAEGIIAIEKGIHDVYLLDYRLGKEDGLELLRQIKAQEMESPFILLTGQDDVELDKEAMEAGASDFLVKGEFSAGILERAIRYAIQQRKTILQLQRSQKRLEEAQKLAHIGHFEWDIQTDKIYWSDEMYRIYGYEPKSFEVTFEFLFEHTYSEDRSLLKNYIEQVKKNKIALSFGYRITTAKNEIRYVYSTREVALDRKGNMTRLFGTIRDVTVEKQYEASIEKEKQTAQTYLDIAGSLMVVIDKEEKITLLNQRGEEILGVAAEEVIGENWFDLFIPVEEREEVRMVFDRLMNDKEQNVEYFENSVLTKKGDKKLIWWHNRVLLNEKDEVQGTISSGVDITKQRESEEKILEYSQRLEQKVNERTIELKESQLKLMEAQSIAKMGHWDFFPKENKLIFSKGMYLIYGLPQDSEISVELLNSLIHPEDIEKVNLEINRAIENKLAVSFNHRIITSNGIHKYVQSNVQLPVFNEKGKLLRVFGVLKDITSLKKSEIQLHEALNKEKELGILKSRFVSMASHEFRTPLSSILSSAELIEMYIQAGRLEKTGKNVLRIKNSVRNLTEILNDFLSLEKLEAGKIEVQKTEINLINFFDELHEEINAILHKDQQFLFKNAVGETIETDPYLLKNILINLTSNAIKYSPNGAPVTLAITEEKNQLLFKVIDRGIGIPEEDRQHMFSRFFRASNVENIKGTGLGLTIVKRYLELMGGTIGFESKYGKGSTFFFYLPK